MGKSLRAWSRIVASLASLLFAAAPLHAAQGTSATQVAVIEPLSLINTGPLSFGYFASGATPGTVTINQTTGARTLTGGVTQLGGTVSPATFLGAAAGLNVVVIRQPNVPVTLTRSGGTETMRITALVIDGGQFRLFFTRQAFTFNIGGTLAVGANQREGHYVGSFPVTVDYY